MVDSPHHPDERSRSQRWVESTALTLIARLCMVLCTGMVAAVLYIFNDKMSDVKDQLTTIRSDLSSVNKGIGEVKTSDAVQSERIANLERRLDGNVRRLDRLEQKVFP